LVDSENVKIEASLDISSQLITNPHKTSQLVHPELETGIRVQVIHVISANTPRNNGINE